jgi:hypothetical protein
LITLVGKQRIASHLATANPTKTVITHCALSDHSGAVSENDLVVEGEDYRTSLTVSANNVTCLSEDTVVATEISASAYTLRKIGFLDASVGGNLICTHKLNTAIALSGSQRLHIIHGLVIT